MKSWRMLLPMLLVAGLARPAQSWQVPSDPYAQPPPPGNGSFRFAPESNAAPPARQPIPGPSLPAPPFQGPPAAPPFQPAPPPFNPVQPQPPAAGLAQYPAQPPGNPAPSNPMQAANPMQPGAAPLVPTVAIPGFDPTLSNPNAPALQGTSLFQPSQIIATVGNQYILYGDVSLTVEQMLRPAIAKVKSEAERKEIESYRPRLVQQVMRQMVESKIYYLEFERAIENKAGRDKMDDVRKEIAKKMRDGFEKQLFSTRESVLKATPEELQKIAKSDPIMPRLAILMKENDCQNMNDLDRVLREYGSSLEKQKQAFTDYNLGRSNLMENIKVKSEVSHLEMLNYYREHAEDFAVKAKARFEIVTVKFANFPNKEAAFRAIAQMGNEIFYGTPFAAVARKGSQDPNAEKGGVYDWTTENSLASEVVNKAIFTLDLGKLSPIIEDERGFHIIRVTEREPAGYIPFDDAQVKIKVLIEQKRREVAYKAYLEMLKAKTTIWTIYDDPPAAANVAAQPAAGPQR